MLVFIFWYINCKGFTGYSTRNNSSKTLLMVVIWWKKKWSTKQYSTFNWMLWEDFLLITHASRFVKGTSIFRKQKKGKKHSLLQCRYE